MTNVEFSESEKVIIKRLVERSEKQLITIGHFLQQEVYNNPNFQIIIIPQKCGLVYYEEGKQSDAYYYLANPVLLLKKLIKSGLIVTLPVDEANVNTPGLMYLGTRNIKCESERDLQFTSGEKIDKSGGHGYWYDEQGNVKYICNRFSFGQLPILDLLGLWPVISPELKTLVKNNFITNEKRTLNWTRFAGCVSFIGLILSIVIPSCVSTKLNDSQYAGIVSSVNDVREELSVSSDAIIKVVDSSMVIIKGRDTIMDNPDSIQKIK